MNLKLYIQSAKQISLQQPLSEEWMTHPVEGQTGLQHAVEANYRDYLSPIESRRMAPIMKRALATTREVLKETGIAQPDAIITGTSIGSLTCTEKFLAEMTENHEQLLKPTHFMQSTHNTVSSMLAIQTKTHGYNSTYSHGTISFDLAVQDAVTQMKLGRISNALIGGYEEMMDSYYELLRKAGYVGREGMCPCGEVSVSMLLTTDAASQPLCELAGVAIAHRSVADGLNHLLQRVMDGTGLRLEDIDAVVTGVNGNPANDAFYESPLLEALPHVSYKQLFGENFTASAFGVYVAAHCLHRGAVPTSMYYKHAPRPQLRNLLVLNQQSGIDTSLILLRKA